MDNSIIHWVLGNFNAYIKKDSLRSHPKNYCKSKDLKAEAGKKRRVRSYILDFRLPTGDVRWNDLALID